MLTEFTQSFMFSLGAFVVGLFVSVLVILFMRFYSARKLESDYLIKISIGVLIGAVTALIGGLAPSFIEEQILQLPDLSSQTWQIFAGVGASIIAATSGYYVGKVQARHKKHIESKSFDIWSKDIPKKE